MSEKPDRDKAMRETIERLFSRELSGIGDRDLRESVVEVWRTAALQGGWRPEDLERIPFTLLTETHGINLVQHTIAVTEGALALYESISGACRLPYDVNRDWLIAGGLLHDVGKLLEIEERDGGFRKSRSGMCARHPISGAILCAAAGMPEEIVNMVACHAKEGEGRPQRPETILIHQADYATFDPLVMLQKGLLIG
ncbi:HD domain-containing protein [Candidatus Fermentibacterales bacterium]|nr:HD domain-containing protein [Candidatus Fermentibacterales bacterium]